MSSHLSSTRLFVFLAACCPSPIRWAGPALRSGLILLGAALLTWPGYALLFPPTATVPTHALRFGGTNQLVAVPASAGLNVTTQLTLEAWINVTAFDKSDMAFVTKGDDLGIVRSGNTSKLAFRTKNGSNLDDLISTTTVVTL